MNSALRPGLLVTSPSPPSEMTVKPLPSTSRLSPAELAQSYRTWWFGPARTVSRDHHTARARR
jgi:hypothetical protein